MSSGFVSGGTADAPIERSDDWLAAQKEIDANAVRKAEAARQTEGRSLFETLEANKAAKQDAFEEANRLKNQFRALDEDEVEFLDSVLESTRADEDRVKRETAEGLALFRQQQEKADKKARRGSEGVAVAEAGSPTGEEETWIAAGRKRKRAKEKEVLKGVKIRRSSTANETGKPSEEAVSATGGSPATKKQSTIAPATATTNSDKSTSGSSAKSPAVVKKPPAKPSLGLVDYGSDEDDD
ncbi:hypothetical protein LOCC1_G004197 [Lachnellula occidentalis]|uniref:FAM192A/Fyv6 N-terminal domain-containing protein n=1 Tax=Lachnellula occidentalis TaxID=215460 RepID=A0A8H8RQY3_9HELO|nr:hypothetical protein LOCC1_G004197 [Lachnellula occidentalis]